MAAPPLVKGYIDMPQQTIGGNATGVECKNTTDAVILLEQPIAAFQLSPGQVVKFLARGRIFQNDGQTDPGGGYGNLLNLVHTLGATALLDVEFYVLDDADVAHWEARYEITGKDASVQGYTGVMAATKQSASGPVFNVGTGNSPYLYHIGDDAAEDSTTDLLFTISAQWDYASIDTWITLDSFKAEWG